MSNYDVIKSEEVFKGKIINVEHDTITLPNGKETIREVVKHGGASAIVAVDNEGKIILIRQYRHPAKSEVLEIPAGMLEKAEDPYVCADRELEEETSFKAGKLTKLFEMYSGIGFCTEILYIYLAEDLKQGNFNFDPDEFIEVEKYTLQECIDMIFNGKIIDSKTIAAILAYKTYKNL